MPETSYPDYDEFIEKMGAVVGDFYPRLIDGCLSWHKGGLWVTIEEDTIKGYNVYARNEDLDRADVSGWSPGDPIPATIRWVLIGSAAEISISGHKQAHEIAQFLYKKDCEDGKVTEPYAVWNDSDVDNVHDTVIDELEREEYLSEAYLSLADGSYQYPRGTDLLWMAYYRKDMDRGDLEGPHRKISGTFEEASKEAHAYALKNGHILQCLKRRY